MSFWRLSTRLRLGHAADTRLSNRWLILARFGWIVLVLFLLGVSVASLPTSFALLHQPCRTALAQCDGYGIGFLTARDIQALPKLGISRDAYAWFWIAITCMTAFVLFGVGGLLFWRRSDDWMALLVALMCINIGATIVTNDLDVSSSLWGVLLGNTVLLLESLAILFTLALFPNGRFVPRWALWVALVYPAYAVFYLGFLNQLHLPGWTLYNNLVNGVAWFGCWIILTGAQLYRYLRVSNAVERQQTKWVAFSFSAVLVVGLVVSPVASFLYQRNVLFYLLVANGSLLIVLIIPFSIVLAIMRSRLWEIDAIINKAMVYGLLSALLAAIYLGLVLSLQALLGGLLHQTNAIALVISTLTIAALFRPLRHRLQVIIDRRFYRHKYDAAKIVAAFSTTLRNEVDLSQLSEELVAVVQETMQPAHVSLWLRPPAPDSKKSTAWSDSPPASQGSTKA
jgi:hypothetical protein